MTSLRGVTGGGSVVPVTPCVVPGTMVVEPFGTTCEEVIGAERREKFFQVVPLLGGSGGMLPPKNFENDAVRLAKNALASI